VTGLVKTHHIEMRCCLFQRIITTHSLDLLCSLHHPSPYYRINPKLIHHLNHIQPSHTSSSRMGMYRKDYNRKIRQNHSSYHAYTNVLFFFSVTWARPGPRSHHLLKPRYGTSLFREGEIFRFRWMIIEILVPRWRIIFRNLEGKGVN
jgi:hypothetical protein